LVGDFKLPHSLSLTMMASARGSSPYNVISGKEIDGNGLFNHRGGLQRNSGNGPHYRNVSLYGSRHIMIPGLRSKHERNVGVDIGIQVDNLLDSTNYVAVDPVESSPLFGRPLAALPGRSVRVWLNLGR